MRTWMDTGVEMGEGVAVEDEDEDGVWTRTSGLAQRKFDVQRGKYFSVCLRGQLVRLPQGSH